MVDLGRTRRRVRQKHSLKATVTTATESELYGDDNHNTKSKSNSNDGMRNRNDDEYECENYHYRSEIQSGGDNDENYTTSSKHKPRQRRTKRKKRRRTEKDPPFLLLFLQVGAVLFMLCLASFHMYRAIFGALHGSMHPTSSVADDDDMYEYEYVGDTDASYGEIAPAHAEHDSDPDSGNPDPGNPDPTPKDRQEQKQLKLNDLLHLPKERHETKETNKTMAPMPIFELSDSAEWDAFGIVNKLKEIHIKTDTDTDTKLENGKSFRKAAQSLRARFVALYGGENAARMLLDKGTTTFFASNNTKNISIGMGTDTTQSDSHKKMGQPPFDVVATACRLHHAKAENRSFTMAFGGYSVTAGRGNKHQDSYPFQLQEILEPIFKAAGFSSNPALSVTNAAIGGVPSFPYGWCMAEFWGSGSRNNDSSNGIKAKANAASPDVVSWDFGMNEASGGPEGLEAYVRHLISTYSTISSSLPPKLIVKDYFTASKRKKVLAEYSSILEDPMVIHTDHAVDAMFEATKTTTSDKEDEGELDARRPIGFRKWREWGAPKGAPGQAPHHPAVQEHKLNAWILAMHFVVALEYMVSMEENTPEENTSSEHSWCPTRDSHKTKARPLSKDSFSSFSLPPPVSRKILNDTELPYDGIFFGYPIEKMNASHSGVGVQQDVLSSSQSSWRMNPMFCRTTFEPTVSGDLSEIVVNGTVGEDLDPTLPKSQYYYNKGWTYDLSEAERMAKRKLSLYPDGLGFRDSKEAYYGIYESPPMTLLLPYQSDIPATSVSLPRAGDLAKDWYNSVVLCQVNNKNTFDSAFADPTSCNFGNDVGIRIGGIDVRQNATKMLDMIGSVYLGKPICKHVPIPSQANLTSHNTLLQEDDRDSFSSAMTGGGSTPKDSRLLNMDQTGLLVEIFVSNPHIVHVHQACSLSHVVWEQKQERSERLVHD